MVDDVYEQSMYNCVISAMHVVRMTAIMHRNIHGQNLSRVRVLFLRDCHCGQLYCQQNCIQHFQKHPFGSKLV